MSLFLDPVVVGSVIVELGQLPPRGQAPAKAIQASPLGADLLDAVLRLVKATQSPRDGKLLLPLITREIIYLLLEGEQGDRLRQMSAIGGHPTYFAGGDKALP